MILPDAALWRQLNSGHLVVVANRMLRQSLLQTITAASGQAAIAEPRLKDLASWLDECWQKLVQTGSSEAVRYRVLSGSEELILWDEVIAGYYRQGSGPLRRTALAEHAVEAHRLLLQWLPEQWPPACFEEFAAESDCSAYLQWQNRFQEICDRHGWLTLARRDLLIEKAFRDNQLDKEPEISLVGYFNLAPRQLELLETASERLNELELTKYKPLPQFCCATDQQRELRQAIGWARVESEKNADAVIAVVIPDLRKRRQLVDRLLREIFSPGSLLPETSAVEGPWLIGSPLPLTRAAAVDVGLQLLQLIVGGGLPAIQIRSLLNSPFWKHFDARQCKILASRLLKWRAGNIDSQQLYRLSRDLDSDFGAVLKSLQRPAERQTSDQWAELFSNWLKQLGWPGQRSQVSAEYQQLERWSNVLNRFASGAEIYGLRSGSAALGILRQEAHLTPFQPASGHNRVMILGVHDAVAFRFDKMWLSGMDDSQWPPLLEANSLLPYSLQQRYGLPGADRNRDLSFFGSQGEELLSCAGELIVSYAQRSDNGDIQQPSPLLPRALREGGGAPPAAERDYCEQWYRQISQSTIEQPIATGKGDALAASGQEMKVASSVFYRAGALSLSCICREKAALGRNAGRPTIRSRCHEPRPAGTRCDAAIVGANWQQQTAAGIVCQWRRAGRNCRSGSGAGDCSDRRPVAAGNGLFRRTAVAA